MLTKQRVGGSKLTGLEMGAGKRKGLQMEVIVIWIVEGVEAQDAGLSKLKCCCDS